MEKNWISFNGFNTKDNNIIIEELNVPPKAEEKKDLITIEGRNGYLTLDYDCYDSIDYEIQLNMYDMLKQVDLIKKFFRGSGELFISKCPDVVYKATIIGNIEFNRTLGKTGNCIINFKLQPLSYVKDVSSIEITSSTTITNNYNSISFPYIKVLGSGRGNLYINDETITFTSIDGFVELDCELENCYKDNNNCNKYMIGDFPVLKEGDNNISFDGNITSIIINPKWRKL